MYAPGVGVRPFHFAHVFSDDASQALVYESHVRPLVTAAVNGFNACVLCYGQTGSGKTFTAFGPDGALHQAQRAVAEGRSVRAVGGSAGVVLRACDEITCLIQEQRELGALSTNANANANAHVTTRLFVQYVEVYMDNVTDLMTGDTVQVHSAAGRGATRSATTTATGSSTGTGSHGQHQQQEQQLNLVGCSKWEVGSMTEALDVLVRGEQYKHRAATLMNERSSRAHTLFVATIVQTFTPAVAGRSNPGGKVDGGAAAQGATRKGAVVLQSQLCMADLAGCEQIKKSGAEGQRRKEAVGINSSLLVLGKCISALAAHKRHVPYLESSLTKLLRGALGGNSRTAVLVAGAMEDAQADETFNALKFGERCSTITNRTKFATASLSEAVAVIDRSIRACEAQVESLEARGKSHLPSMHKCKERLVSLRQKRKQLGD